MFPCLKYWWTTPILLSKLGSTIFQGAKEVPDSGWSEPWRKIPQYGFDTSSGNRSHVSTRRRNSPAFNVWRGDRPQIPFGHSRGTQHCPCRTPLYYNKWSASCWWSQQSSPGRRHRCRAPKSRGRSRGMGLQAQQYQVQSWKWLFDVERSYSSILLVYGFSLCYGFVAKARVSLLQKMEGYPTRLTEYGFVVHFCAN